MPQALLKFSTQGVLSYLIEHTRTHTRSHMFKLLIITGSLCCLSASRTCDFNYFLKHEHLTKGLKTLLNINVKETLAEQSLDSRQTHRMSGSRMALHMNWQWIQSGFNSTWNADEYDRRVKCVYEIKCAISVWHWGDFSPLDSQRCTSVWQDDSVVSEQLCESRMAGMAFELNDWGHE